MTPYMGVWDKSTGSTGTSLSPRPLSEGNGQDLIGSEMPNHSDGTDWDMSRVGQFAYCLEATESMSRVTSCFLQQSVDFSIPKEVSWWLGRFKELDLRLAHWKLLLPHVSKPANPSLGAKMDPNLTLAHITHNASTILLHQPIAYPPPTWQFRGRLPSSWSASTCCHAASEISTITQRFLRNLESHVPISSQFTFCLYIAGRMMLVDWKYYGKKKLSDDFWLIIESLIDMGQRWNGKCTATEGNQVTAMRYVTELRRLRELCLQHEAFQPDFNDYTQGVNLPENAGYDAHTPSGATLAGLQNEQAHPRLTMDWVGPAETQRLFHTGPTPAGAAKHVGEHALFMEPGTVYFGNDEASASQEQQELGALNSEVPEGVGDFLMHLDRVIAYDDGSLFTTNLDQSGW